MISICAAYANAFAKEAANVGHVFVVVVTLYLTCLISYVVPEGHAGRLVGRGGLVPVFILIPS